MATIKSYSDLQQSKKLAEILPLESADMGWNVFVDGTTRILPINDWDLVKDGSWNVKFYHAWSLAALLGAIPCSYKVYRHPYDDVLTLSLQISNCIEVLADNEVDACYEMILTLHELKVL